MAKVTIACTVDPTILAKAQELRVNISQTLENTLKNLILEKEPEFKTDEQFAILQRSLKEANRQLAVAKANSDDMREFLKEKGVFDKYAEKKIKAKTKKAKK